MAEKSPPNHRWSVTIDDFVRFLVAKTGDAKCPACGNGQWTILGSGETNHAYRVNTSLRDGGATKALNTFAIFCDECGYAREHLSRIVKLWVEQNPGPEQLELDDLDDLDGTDSDER
ncbi:hypothetical protein [Pseudomonas peradeniyensis]|uniref:HNH endonuclease n=1 Tax=Pseudomonas peradeniyensis TaxID=2745488 RepID=A0ABT2VF69_9PSED|nr:hypothetical protein [Pseudomonas peradeniyensis]MCU7240384.1 hypothetical protein [Pseudomonas peradeniyensis]